MFDRKLLCSLMMVALLLTLTAATTAAGECSVASVRGTYVASEQGEVVVAAPPVFPAGPFVLTANPTFDGAGQFSGTYMAAIGDGTVRTGDFSGTYAVGADCSYSDEFTITVTFQGVPITVKLHHKGFLSGNGVFQEAHYIYVDGDSAISGTAKKQ